MAVEQPLDGYLFDLYRRYIGEPDDRTDVYLGFGLFLCGIALAIAALALFVWSSTTFEPRSAEFFTWAGPAYALGMVSLPATMLGIVVLLPSERRVLYGSVGGAVITLVAVGLFVELYPDDWNFFESAEPTTVDLPFTALSLVLDIGTVHVVTVYAVGLAGITASTGAALIAHYLDLARTVETLEEEEDDGEHYTDEEIRGDIDAAMEDVELSWGGVAKTDSTRLDFTDHDFDETNLGGEAKRTRSSGVDEQVAGLKGLKGGETKTETSGRTVDDQTAKLKQLRERREREAERGGGGLRGAVDARIAGVKSRVSAIDAPTGVVGVFRDKVKRN